MRNVVMKINKINWLLPLLYFTLVASCFGQSITNSLDVQTYSEVTTNWGYVTNSFDIYYGVGNDTNNIYTVTHDHPDAYVGTVTSNNICNVFYDKQLKSSFILSSKKIEMIKVVWENKTIYTTNYYDLN